jgi:hypothetical protein
MKQTAVEWLIEQLWQAKKTKSNWKIIEEQAKAMEKEHMLDFFCNGLLDVAEDDLSFDDYFNEKFKAEE